MTEEEQLDILMKEVEIETISGKTADFIVSLSDYKDRKGYLTEPQKACVRSMYEEHIGV